ncbi:uncharacterized protein CTRU02_207760 [Colletotrichum truncatum]|uniref:Uncharacterized protein n=1 Tax=Colletotrichum truncatum TaxID=5467 RepID=A0ACC3Z1R3_COLTU|nr:uncharacterized protein CTRU02_09139 [Colletotrichum truncatum]KAF6788818.1 hypothetical protein CTRU02_09139 [Colletotrichum truncatum]
MSGYSNVGTSGVYEAGDQRNVKNSELQDADRFHEGNIHSHVANDSKDQRSIANRLAAEEKKAKEGDEGDDAETRQSKIDPTLPAKMHGNEPSAGAKVDAQLQAEDEERLRQKGKA